MEGGAECAIPASSQFEREGEVGVLTYSSGRSQNTSRVIGVKRGREKMVKFAVPDICWKEGF